MRKQIAAANWKMNLTLTEAKKLASEVAAANPASAPDSYVVLAVPFPYLTDVQGIIAGSESFHLAAQNCATEKSGAFTGEVSTDMLASVQVDYVLIGHSERRDYYNETDEVLVKKLARALESDITPIFCCGEALAIRDAGTQNDFVAGQLEGGLFHLDAEAIEKIVIAYEPIWAIGTGRTASSAQAQEMHAHIRSVLAKKYSTEVAEKISILYGGSVKAASAVELFSQPDVDGGLVGGASLVATEFISIIESLKKPS